MKFKSEILLILLIFLLSILMSGCKKTEKMLFELSADGSFYYFAKYNGDSNKVVIPSTHNQLPVTGIRKRAFLNKSSITKIVIPDSITDIEEQAFIGCSSLISIEIPNSVTTIGTGAFEGCSSLTKIVIPENVTSIGEYVFYGCSDLSEIIVDDNNKIYDSRDNCNAIIETRTNTLIQGCYNTKIPESVTDIGDSAFRHCSRLTSIKIPKSVSSIGNYAFESCEVLTSVEIPNNVESIGNGAFFGCENLIYNAFDNAKYLGNKDNPYLVLVDATVRGITSCEINNNTKIIYDEAFYECSNLKKIKIPNSVTSIGNMAFYGCSRLTSIEISENITYIDDYAFSGCERLRYNIYDNAKYLGNEDNQYIVLMETINDDIVSCEINSSTKIIYYKAFLSCKNLTNLMIPETVTYIGGDAFGGCSSLISINLPENITSIKSGTFIGCVSLTSIEIPESVRNIGRNAFSGCISLTSIEIPENVLVIGKYAFCDCANLTSIVIPNGVKYIYEGAFYSNSLTIYCETMSQPIGWSSDWILENTPVVWGYNN